MKYFWCSLALLSALGIGCWLASSRITELTTQTALVLDAVQRAAQADEMEAAQSGVEEALALWNAHRGFWGTVLHHDETDELTYRFASLMRRAQEQNREEVLCGAAELQAMLHHLAEMEQPVNFL